MSRSDNRRRNRSSLLDLASQASIWLSPSSCSRSCLDQVESFEVEDDAGSESGDGTCSAIPTSLDVSKSELGDASLLDHDESAASMEQTSVNSLSSGQGGIKEGQPQETEMCLICLTEMSLADLRYPIMCRGHSCDYNFCLICAEEFLKSSKDDYQVASDGSRQVKIHLRCPNCRSDISTQIEETIQRRTEFLHSTEHPCTPARTPLPAVDESRLGPGFDPDNTIGPGVYLNRSGTTRSGKANLFAFIALCSVTDSLLPTHDKLPKRGRDG